MDLRSSSKFRQTTTGAALRRRREQVLGPDHDRQNIRTFSRQLNHYQTQVTWFINNFVKLRQILYIWRQTIRYPCFKNSFRWHKVSHIKQILKEKVPPKYVLFFFQINNVTSWLLGDNKYFSRSVDAGPVSGIGTASLARTMRGWVTWTCRAASTRAPPAGPPWRPSTRLSPWAATNWTRWPAATGYGTWPDTCFLLNTTTSHFRPNIGPVTDFRHSTMAMCPMVHNQTAMWYLNTKEPSTAKMNIFLA